MTRSEPIATTEHTYLAVFEPAEKGGYVVYFPSLSRLVTEGETLEEARAMAQDVLTSYLKLLRKRGQRIPESDVGPATSIRESVTAKLDGRRRTVRSARE